MGLEMVGRGWTVGRLDGFFMFGKVILRDSFVKN